MKVIISGSRDFIAAPLIAQAVELSGWLPAITEVVSGCARGIDRLGEFWALQHSIPIKQFPADWQGHGKLAGIYRNVKMAEYADALIAIWDGESRGTGNMIEEMRRVEKPVFVYCLEGSAKSTTRFFTAIERREREQAAG